MERLCSWLARVHGADPLLDEALDDAQREFLLSYRLPAPEADTPGGGSRRSIACTAPRQYILPARSGARTPRGSCGSAADLAAAAAGEPSRHSSEEGEALVDANDPELQRMLRAVRGAWLAGVLLGCHQSVSAETAVCSCRPLLFLDVACCRVRHQAESPPPRPPRARQVDSPPPSLPCIPSPVRRLGGV